MGKYKYENTGEMPVNSRAKVKVEFSSGSCSEDQAADLNWSLVEYGLSNIVSWEYVNPSDDPASDDQVPFPPHMFYWQQPTRKPNPDLAILVEVERYDNLTETYAASRLYDVMTEHENAAKYVKRWRYTEEPVVAATQVSDATYILSQVREHQRASDEFLGLRDKPSYVRQLAKRAIDTIDQRGTDYDAPDGERSGPSIATAFNAITGKSITPAEVYLLHSITKSVRQWQCPDRHHTDSGIDRVAYDLLIDEALHLQFATSPTDEDKRDE